MALDPLVSVDELATWLRVTFTDDEAETAGLYLASVSGLIRSEAGAASAPWSDVSTVPETVRTVAFTVAARIWRNPDAASTITVTRGPFGKTLVFADPKAAGLYLDDNEKAIVGRSRIQQRGLWTLGTARNDLLPMSWPYATTGFVSVEGSDDPMPWFVDDGCDP